MRVPFQVISLWSACADPPAPEAAAGPAALAYAVGVDTCADCHGATAGGIEDAHPFGGGVSCVACHGGDNTAPGAVEAHVPPPPEAGADDIERAAEPRKHYAYLTRTGLDRVSDWTIGGVTYTALDYLQFLDPGDARVAGAGRGCAAAGCHDAMGGWVERSVMTQGQGLFSASLFGTGASGLGALPTDADYGFRAVTDPAFVADASDIGRIESISEWPVRASYGDTTGIYSNPAYDAAGLSASIDAEGKVIDDSPLHHIAMEAISAECSECHAGSAGSNETSGRYRAGGCTSCHMPYAVDGRSRSADPNIPKFEPVDPDSLEAPERPHPATHEIVSKAGLVDTDNGPVFVSGLGDSACLSCHVGSNATVLQYWGLRLDPGGDVLAGEQYPSNPQTFSTAASDARLFDPAILNESFAGYEPGQILSFEDYDGDSRDDTPPDVHSEAGLVCIDCHGGADLHGGIRYDDGSGLVESPISGRLRSRMNQAVGVTCESCHGSASSYASTIPCVADDGLLSDCATDRLGSPLRNVTMDASGNFYLASRIDGVLHYVPQTLDLIVDNGVLHPLTGGALYNPMASYAMGRANLPGPQDDGIGPLQADPSLYANGFSHLDTMDCDACHAAWTTTCVGCHLTLVSDESPDRYWFSPITGERVAVYTTEALTYSNPIWSTLVVSASGKIGAGQAGTKSWLRYTDRSGLTSDAFALSDRLGNGNNTAGGRSPDPALSHDRAFAHSIRGAVTPESEGVKHCVACHLDQDQMAAYGAQYASFVSAMDSRDYASVDYTLLAEQIGENTGNQRGSPFYVRMSAGLGTGLLLFDADGCPDNPIDTSARPYCSAPPATLYDPSLVAYNLDAIVESSGVENASTHNPARNVAGIPLRAGALQPTQSGPLGAALVTKLADPYLGLVLDSWVDADGLLHGSASLFVPAPAPVETGDTGTVPAETGGETGTETGTETGIETDSVTSSTDAIPTPDDTGDPALPAEEEKESASGCGCGSSPARGALWVVALAAVTARRRRLG